MWCALSDTDAVARAPPSAAHAGRDPLQLAPPLQGAELALHRSPGQSRVMHERLNARVAVAPVIGVARHRVEHEPCSRRALGIAHVIRDAKAHGPPPPRPPPPRRDHPRPSPPRRPCATRQGCPRQPILQGFPVPLYLQLPSPSLSVRETPDSPRASVR